MIEFVCVHEVWVCVLKTISTKEGKKSNQIHNNNKKPKLEHILFDELDFCGTIIGREIFYIVQLFDENKYNWNPWEWKRFWVKNYVEIFMGNRQKAMSFVLLLFFSISLLGNWPKIDNIMEFKTKQQQQQQKNAVIKRMYFLSR